MNATQFIKDHGLEKAREVVEGVPDGADHIADFTFSGEYTYLKNINGNEYEEFRDGDWVHVNHLTFSSELSLGLVCIDLPDLKRLVESVALVIEHYTVERAKIYANSPYTAPEVKQALERAIADYESIYGGGNE